MRLAYLAPFDLTVPAGHASHVLATVRELARKGHEVTLLARGCPEDVAAFVRFVAVPAVSRSGLESISFGAAAAAALAPELVRRRPDVVYTRYFKSASLPLLAARAARVPGIVEVNSDTSNERRTRRKGDLLARAEEAEERLCYRAAAAVIAVTEAVAHNVRRVEPRAAGKVEVVWNGVDTGLFRPLDRDECARKHGLDPGRKRVVFTGTFQVWQGLLDLVAAMGTVAAARADADLLLVGDGPQREAVERAVAEAGLGDRVRITGFVPEAEVVELICASDVCAAPYNADAVSDAEADRRRPGAPMRGSPLKIYSYLGCGLPVAASHFLEAGEHLERHGAGVSIPPEDPGALALAILGLLEDPARARALAARGRELALERHDWSKVVDEYLRIAAEAGR